MQVTISTYQDSRDYDKLMDLIRSEGEEWTEYLDPKYRLNLTQSITHVAYAQDKLCGYSRSINDKDFFVWVIDLLVNKLFRGHSIGKMLLERVKADFPGQDIYVMSDVDEYYQKLGYSKEGSIFKVG